MIPALLIPAAIHAMGSPHPEEIQPGLFVIRGIPEEEVIHSLGLVSFIHVIDLRRPSEGDLTLESEAIGNSWGGYFNLPMDRNPTPAQLDSFRARLSSLSPGAKVLVHCASGSRAGGALFAYWVLDGGLSVEDALRLARKAGLSHPETEAAVKAYISARHLRVGHPRFSTEDSE